MIIVLRRQNVSRSQRILWILHELRARYEVAFHQRDARINLAPVELHETHGKSPVIPEGDRVVAKSGAIIDHIVRGHDDGPRNLL